MGRNQDSGSGSDGDDLDDDDSDSEEDSDDERDEDGDSRKGDRPEKRAEDKGERLLRGCVFFFFLVDCNCLIRYTVMPRFSQLMGTEKHGDGR